MTDSQKEVQRWDYASIIPSQYAVGDLDRIRVFGQDGWELVCTAPNGVYIFKRPIVAVPAVQSVSQEDKPKPVYGKPTEGTMRTPKLDTK